MRPETRSECGSVAAGNVSTALFSHASVGPVTASPAEKGLTRYCRNTTLSNAGLSHASTTALVQKSVDLCPVFLDDADSDARDGEQFGGRSGALRGHAFNAWSLKIRNAGTPRRLASARRHVRRVSSMRES